MGFSLSLLRLLLLYLLQQILTKVIGGIPSEDHQHYLVGSFYYVDETFN